MKKETGSDTTLSALASLKRESVAGCAAGVVGTLIGFPLDSIKLRMQLGNEGLIKSAQGIYRDGGIAGFYRGVGSPLLALTILNTLNFSSYSYVSKKFLGDTPFSPFEWRVGAAAMAVGPMSAMISTPFELIKTQMQININSSKVQISTSTTTATNNSFVRFRHSLHATVHIVRTEGVSALYKAHAVNTLREMVFLGTYFTVYEHLKFFMLNSQQQLFSNIAVVAPISGGFAGSIGWFVSFPLDCIKAQIQGVPYYLTSATGHPQRSTVTVLRDLLRTRGVLGLYSGVLPSILRAFLVSSSRFSVYEGTLWLLDENSAPTKKT